MKAPSVKRLVEAFSDQWDKLDAVPGLPVDHNDQDYHEDRAKLIRRIAHATDMPEGGGRMSERDRLRELIDKHCPVTERYYRSCHHNPFDCNIWRVTMALHAIDRLMGGFGVESFGPLRRGDYAPAYEYINLGDAYATTLLYRRKTDRLIIGCWGAIAEKHPKWS